MDKKKEDIDIKKENFEIKGKKSKLLKLEERLSTVPIRLTEAIKEKKDKETIIRMFRNYINLQNDIWELEKDVFVTTREYLLRQIGGLQDIKEETERILAGMISDRYCLLRHIREVLNKQRYSIWDKKIVKIISPHINLGEFKNKLAEENKRKSSKQKKQK